MEEQQENVAVEVETPAEKMIPQSEVNSLVGSAKAQAAERARRAAEEEYKQKLQQQQQALSSQQETAAQSQQVDQEALYQQVTERLNSELQQRQLEEQMAGIATSFQQQMSDAANNYEDFGEVTKDFNPAEMPSLVYLMSVAGVSNIGDVVYELQKNPSKLAEMLTLVDKAPSTAKSQLQRLSNSISENRKAQQDAANQSTDAPLSRLQPSRVSGRGGEMSIKDYRSQSFLKG